MVWLKPNSTLCVFKTGGFCYSPLYPFRIIKLFCIIYVAVIVQSLSRVRLCMTLWTAACQVFLSFTVSQSLLKFMSTESVICNHLIFCTSFSCPQSFPASGSFPMSQLSASGGQSIGASALTSVLPMSIPDWSSLGLTGWISLQSKGLSRIFSNTTVQKYQFFVAQLSL